MQALENDLEVRTLSSLHLISNGSVQCVSLQRQLDALRDKANEDEKKEKASLEALQADLKSAETEKSTRTALYSQSKRTCNNLRIDKDSLHKKLAQAKELAVNTPVLNAGTEAPVIEMQASLTTIWRGIF